MVWAIVAVVITAVLAWRPLRGATWRAAARTIAGRLPLGSDSLVRGAEPTFEGGQRRAALLLHGFGDTPQSLAHLARRLVDSGWTVSVPLLPGHGRTLAEFQNARAHEWTSHAQQAFDELAARHTFVVVCGQSMGAALALELAVARPVAALALLAPYIAMPFSARVAATAWPLVQAVSPVWRTRDGRSIQDPDAEARSLAYGYTTPRLLSELWRVVRRARGNLRAIDTPTFIVHSREDNRVPPREVLRAAATMKHPVAALHWVSGCGHVLTADYCKDAVATLVIDWFERCTAAHGAAATAR